MKDCVMTKFQGKR